MRRGLRERSAASSHAAAIVVVGGADQARQKIACENSAASASSMAQDSALPQSPDLAGHGRREILDERDLARILVRRQAGFHVRLDAAREFLAGRVTAQHLDEGLDRLAALGIGHANHGAGGHARHFHHRGLDLGRTDAVAGGLDEIIGAALEMDPAFRVAATHVAGAAPLAGELLPHRGRVVPAFAHHHRIVAPHRNLAGRTVRDRLAGAVHQRHDVSRIRLAERRQLRHFAQRLEHGRRQQADQGPAACQPRRDCLSALYY
jgi:hypothetical protein